MEYFVYISGTHEPFKIEAEEARSVQDALDGKAVQVTFEHKAGKIIVAARHIVALGERPAVEEKPTPNFSFFF